MKITNVEVIPVSVARESPDRPDRAPLYTVVVVMRTDDGLEGIGHTMAPRKTLFAALLAAVRDLAELLIGEDAREPERLYYKMQEAARWFAPGGLVDVAVCALDIAAWDLAAKALQMPLYRLLGGHRDRIPAYASTFLGRTLSIEQLRRTAESLIDQGFHAIKMNVAGQHSLSQEVARVRAVRAAVGEDVQLMADATWLWSPWDAIRVGRAIEEYLPTWLEDPVPSEDVGGLAEVAGCLDTPIAAGERLFGITPFRDLLERKALDIVMVDLMRCGGITPFRRIAALSEVFCRPVVSHLQYEVCAHLIAAVPNGMTVEWMPWTSPLFNGLPQLEDGQLVLTSRPGHGLELDREFVDKHAL
jgi:L-talarate/galactarate dehydratase